MTRIKFCGLTRPEDIEYVNSLKPDYIGFVFAKKSRRAVTKEKAAELKAMLSPDIKAVGVFVDATSEYVTELLSEGVIDIAQLHGDENESYIEEVKRRTGKSVIKAFRVNSAEDVKLACESKADLILLDSGTGSGQTFDWSILTGIGREWFLAGGLDIGNVSQAVKELGPYGVDVSSGIETEGYKDISKMEAFIKAVRRGEEQ